MRQDAVGAAGLPEHHPSDATLLVYAAGALGEGLSLAVAGHLAFCSACRDAVGAGDAIGGALLDTLAPVGLSAAAHDAIANRLKAALPLPREPVNRNAADRDAAGRRSRARDIRA